MGLYSRGIVLERNIILNNSQSFAGKLNTDIDRLYYMVRAAGNVRLSYACKTLHIARKQAEEYAGILADQNLITIHRPLIGDAVLESLDRIEPKTPKGPVIAILLICGVLPWNEPS